MTAVLQFYDQNTENMPLQQQLPPGTIYLYLCACTVSKLFLLSQPNSVALKNINHHIST